MESNDANPDVQLKNLRQILNAYRKNSDYKKAINTANKRIANKNNTTDIKKKFMEEIAKIEKLLLAKKQAKKDLENYTLISDEELQPIKQQIETIENVNTLNEFMNTYNNKIRLNTIQKLRDIQKPPRFVTAYLGKIDSGQDDSIAIHPKYTYMQYKSIKSDIDNAITYLKKQKEANPNNTNANDAIQLIESHAESPHTILSKYRAKRSTKEDANKAKEANKAKTNDILLFVGPFVVIIIAILVFAFASGSGFQNMNETEINPVTVTVIVIVLIILFVLIWSK